MGQHRVLLVDDHLLQAELLEASFTQSGFAISMAHDGIAALNQLESHAVRLDALVTDIKLGKGPNGWEVARRAREIIPDVAVVYMTGDSAREWILEGVLRSRFLAKPFPPAEVIRVVSALLSDPGIDRAA